MKAVQIRNYSKNINAALNDIAKPSITDSEVLIQVKAAAVNPVELLIMTGSVKLIQGYSMPLTLGNFFICAIFVCPCMFIGIH